MKPLQASIDPENQPHSSKLKSAVDQLLAELSPVIESNTDQFEVAVGERTLFFRRPQSLETIKAFQKHGLEFVVNTLGKKAPSPEMRELMSTRTVDDLIGAFTLHYFSVAPTKFSTEQAIRLTRAAGVMNHILGVINKEFDCGINSVFLRKVEAEKKGSKATTSDGFKSQSPEMSTGSTTKTSTRKGKTE